MRHTPVLQAMLCMAILATLTRCAATAEVEQDADVGPATTIQNKGSDTMVNIALGWAEAYGQIRPEVQIAVTGGGSGTGIASLINGTVDMANASRPIKPEERSQAEVNNISPREHVVAQDAIAIVVHPSNPVNRLTVPQLSAIFAGKITNWRQVGGGNAPIVLLSRESNSGTHVFFLEHVVRQGDSQDRTLFSPNTLLMPSSEGISAEVRQNPNAIGYDGLGYVTDDQKVVAVAVDVNAPYVLPTLDTVRDESYPIARELYIYTAGEPEGAIRDYLRWIVGPEGQRIVEELGFVPLPRANSTSSVHGAEYETHAHAAS